VIAVRALDIEYKNKEERPMNHQPDPLERPKRSIKPRRQPRRLPVTEISPEHLNKLRRLGVPPDFLD
jgi:hypothetical protein